MPKIEVIPAINAESFEEVKNKIKLVEPYTKWVHLDVADGTFTPNTLWHEPSDLLDLETDAFIEVHLMMADMDGRFSNWILPNVKRIIFHAEAAHDPEFVIGKIKESGKEAGIAILPQTRAEKGLLYCHKADLVQTLAVFPGKAGQEFHPEIVEKIKHIREKSKDCIIEVDGGINLETGKECVRSGANILVSANYIFNSSSIEEAINNLKNL